MDTKVIELGNNTKVIEIELSKDGDMPSEVIAEYFDSIDNGKNGADEANKEKQLHDELVKKLLNTSKIIKATGRSVDEAMDAAFEGYNPEDDMDCYCPCCLAKSVITLTYDDILEIGADVVKTTLSRCYTNTSIKTKRDLDAVANVISYADSLIVDKAKSKSIDDMTRDELIAELKKRSK